MDQLRIISYAFCSCSRLFDFRARRVAGTRGAPRDMEIHLREVLATTRRMAEIISHHTGRPVEQVERDIDRDYYMTAGEAKEYGLIDEIITPRRGISAAVMEQAGRIAKAS